MTADASEAGYQEGPVVRDRRRLDPVTGEVRRPEDGAGSAADSTATPDPTATPGPTATAAGSGPGAGPTRVDAEGQGQQAGTGADAAVTEDVTEPPSAEDELTVARALAQERLDDLQRLQAEYVNYRRRVERDRDVARGIAVSGVLEGLLPVLDDIHLARQHGDLTGPFVSIADKLESVLTRYGLDRYGEAGELFDPTVHEALMSSPDDTVQAATVAQVLQPGYRVGDRVLRAARVAVAEPPA